MLEVRRQVEFLSILLFLLLALIDVRTNMFDYTFRICAETAQHVDKQAVVFGKHIENISRFDRLASTRAGAFQGTLKKIGGIRRNANTFADMLPGIVHPMLDRPRHGYRIQSETSHCGIKEI